MALHSHRFVEEYEGLVGYGLDRPTDEATLCVYLQKLSDDECMKALIPRMTEKEMEQLFDQIGFLLKRHFEEDEYHSIFLKDEHGEG